jgi:hypothetical protein
VGENNEYCIDKLLEAENIIGFLKCFLWHNFSFYAISIPYGFSQIKFVISLTLLHVADEIETKPPDKLIDEKAIEFKMNTIPTPNLRKLD